ncbi:MAG: nuclear transport factor 2 family protein [Bacteroidetes bacterium]|nr:nuclear transport factor 2 family protein [Bacteroidota bacterium]
MRFAYVIIPLLLFKVLSCKNSSNNEKIKDEIINVEKSFQQMTVQKGIAEAFYFYADDNAVIKRENDTLIIGKENIKRYYQEQNLKDVKVNWKPDFIEVSKSGDVAYTYGKYVWEFTNEAGAVKQIRGVFHTVWKKQNDGSWKYAWD